MMKIRVFDINTTVHEEKLVEKDIENIKKVFDKIFDPRNTEHLKISCSSNSDSLFIDFKKDSQNFDSSILASNLHQAEQKKDGTRNGQITEGYLFVKIENSQLTLLKLENIEVVDKEQHYAMRTSFSTETNYYKGCIFKGDLDNITVIDKNPSIAKYWREKFLKLSLNRDEYQNSKELILLLKEDKLFAQNIRSQENFKSVKEETENYIFETENFDKVRVADLLRTKGFIDKTKLNEIFSESSKDIDTEFAISKKAVKEAYKKTIQVSEDTKIYSDNYVKLVKRQGIEYRDGKLILTVSEDFIDKIPEEIRNGN